MRQKKKKKIGGGSCPPGKYTVFGGGKCPNLGVVNVRILGVVNVRLANNLTPFFLHHNSAHVTTVQYTVCLLVSLQLLCILVSLQLVCILVGL